MAREKGSILFPAGRGMSPRVFTPGHPDYETVKALRDRGETDWPADGAEPIQSGAARQPKAKSVEERKEPPAAALNRAALEYKDAKQGFYKLVSNRATPGKDLNAAFQRFTDARTALDAAQLDFDMWVSE